MYLAKSGVLVAQSLEKYLCESKKCEDEWYQLHVRLYVPSIPRGKCICPDYMKKVVSKGE